MSPARSEPDRSRVRPGETLGDYRIIAKLGEGGMGEVFLAEHTRIYRAAALKVLHGARSENALGVQRLFDEARATARIRHPGIVDVLDCNVDGAGRAYIAMEFLEGRDSATVLAQAGPFDGEVPVALAVVARCAAALGAAHARGIIHRDVKPANVFVVHARAAGGTPAVKLLDFGVARFAAAGPAEAFTGTPRYMSPEQCRGAGEFGPASDVYALGCVLFEMLTGRPPFLHQSPGELIAAHLTEPAPRASSLRPGLPAPVDELLARMLAKAPEQRPATMESVVAAVEGCLGASARDLDRLLAGSRLLAAAEDGGPAPAPVTVPGALHTTELTRQMRVGADTADLSARSAPSDPHLVVGHRRRAPWAAVAIGVAALAAALALLQVFRPPRGAEPAPTTSPRSPDVPAVPAQAGPRPDPGVEVARPVPASRPTPAPARPRVRPRSPAGGTAGDFRPVPD